MTNAVDVRLAPVGETPLPDCRLGGTDNDIPIVTWKTDGPWPATVELSLGNHADPRRYLEDLGRRLIAFAHEVHQAELDRQPIPYVVVEHVPGCNDHCVGESHHLDDRQAAEMTQ